MTDTTDEHLRARARERAGVIKDVEDAKVEAENRATQYDAAKAAYEAELQAAKAVTPIPPGATWPPYLNQAADGSASDGTGLGKQAVEGKA